MRNNQVLQDKYPHLEVSVLKLSEVKKDNESFRIDAEYFKKEYLEIEKLLLTNAHIILGEEYDISKLAGFEFTEYFTESSMSSTNSYIALTSKNIQNNILDLTDTITIDKTIADEFLQRSKIYKNDIILSYTGEYRRSLVIQDRQVFQLGPNVCRIRQIKKQVNPYFVSIFLNSEIGQTILNKEKTLSAQPTIAMSRIRKLPIPLLPMPFQLEIEKLVKDSHKALESSKALYKEAEALLYEALGLDSKNPLQSILNTSCKSLNKYLNMDCYKFDKLNSRNDEAVSPNTTIATLKESFLKTGRLDAEYYQSKYEDIEIFIKNYGYVTLQDLEIQDKNYTPKQEKQYHYIELANIGSNGNISTPTQDFGKNLPTRARRIVKEGDVIISSIEGSLSSCALITKEFDSCLVSTGFYVLRSKHINGETLLVLFKSEIFQDYLKKFPSGTILSATSKEELQNILIPKIDSTTQAQIATHIQKSFELRAEAKKLLESAKAEVESALNDTNNGGGGGKSCPYSSANP